MTEIYLVRHGEVDGNVDRKFIGLTEHKLNTIGIEQVIQLNNRLKEEFDIAYVSPLIRTRQTFEILEKTIKVTEIKYCDELKERNFGIFEDKSAKEVEEKYPNEYSMLCEDWENFKIPEGESAKESYLRICTAFDEIVNNNIGKKILLVTHMGCIRFLLAYKISGQMGNLWNFSINNGSYTKFEEHDGLYVLSKLNG